MERLERLNRRLRQTVIGAVAVGLFLLVMEQMLPPKVHDVVRAKKLVVVRDDGRTMVTIGSGRQSGLIGVWDSRATPIVGIGADDERNGQIMAYSTKGKMLVGIGAPTKGGIKGGPGQRQCVSFPGGVCPHVASFKETGQKLYLRKYKCCCFESLAQQLCIDRLHFHGFFPMAKLFSSTKTYGKCRLRAILQFELDKFLEI